MKIGRAIEILQEYNPEDNVFLFGDDESIRDLQIDVASEVLEADQTDFSVVGGNFDLDLIISAQDEEETLELLANRMENSMSDTQELDFEEQGQSPVEHQE